MVNAPHRQDLKHTSSKLTGISWQLWGRAKYGEMKSEEWQRERKTDLKLVLMGSGVARDWSGENKIRGPITPQLLPPSFSNYKLHVCRHYRHEISFNHRKVSNWQSATPFCNSLRDRSCPCVAEQGEKVREERGQLPERTEAAATAIGKESCLPLSLCPPLAFTPWFLLFPPFFKRVAKSFDPAKKTFLWTLKLRGKVNRIILTKLRYS